MTTFALLMPNDPRLRSGIRLTSERFMRRLMARMSPRYRLMIYDPSPYGTIDMTALTLPNDATATLAVACIDQVGRPVAMPGQLSVMSNASVGAAVGRDGASIVISPLRVGTFTVTLASGDLASELDVDVVEYLEKDTAHGYCHGARTNAPDR